MDELGDLVAGGGAKGSATGNGGEDVCLGAFRPLPPRVSGRPPTGEGVNGTGGTRCGSTGTIRASPPS